MKPTARLVAVEENLERLVEEEDEWVKKMED